MGDIYREKIKNICIKVENNKFYKALLKNPWPYFVGATLIAIINILLLKLTNIPLRVSSWFTFLGAGILDILGFEMSNINYFGRQNFIFSNSTSFFNTYYTFLNIGIILGAFIASLWASQFKVKKIKNKKQIVLALSGGILMGYSSRIAIGCNLGAYFSAIPSFSLHGWVFAISTFIGAYIGGKILIKNIL